MWCLAFRRFLCLRKCRRWLWCAPGHPQKSGRGNCSNKTRLAARHSPRKIFSPSNRIWIFYNLKIKKLNSRIEKFQALFFFEHSRTYVNVEEHFNIHIKVKVSLNLISLSILMHKPYNLTILFQNDTCLLKVTLKQTLIFISNNKLLNFFIWTGFWIVFSYMNVKECSCLLVINN